MLRQEIGLKSLIFIAPGNLGTKERMVAFVVAERKLVAKKFLMAETTSGPIVSHEALKNPDVRPSGPGALFGLSLKKVDVISSSVGMDNIR